MVLQDDVLPEINMSADKARHELIPAAPLVPYRCIPRHTSPRAMHGITGDVRHRWQPLGNGGRRPRAQPLMFNGAQRRRGQNEGPHVDVAPIEALEPTVSPRQRHHVAIKGGGVRIYI